MNKMAVLDRLLVVVRFNKLLYSDPNDTTVSPQFSLLYSCEEDNRNSNY